MIPEMKGSGTALVSTILYSTIRATSSPSGPSSLWLLKKRCVWCANLRSDDLRVLRIESLNKTRICSQVPGPSGRLYTRNCRRSWNPYNANMRDRRKITKKRERARRYRVKTIYEKIPIRQGERRAYFWINKNVLASLRSVFGRQLWAGTVLSWMQCEIPISRHQDGKQTIFFIDGISG